jgi:predicted phosphodiesterase
MKYGIVSDIHGNLEALTVVLEKCKELGVIEYICVGDIVGYNANPSECLDIVRNLPLVAAVKGNHDEEASIDSDLNEFNEQASQAIAWTRNQLNAEQKVFLSELPYKSRIGRITVVHASLDELEEWGYVMDKYAADASMSYQLSQICFYGHSHVPMAFDRCHGKVEMIKSESFIVKPGHKYFVNPGSVGQPRDKDCRASFAIYDSEDCKISFYRVDYDVKSAQAKILDVNLPKRLAERLELGN